MVRRRAERAVSNHGRRTQAAPHRPPSSFETAILAARGWPPQDEGGVGEFTCRYSFLTAIGRRSSPRLPARPFVKRIRRSSSKQAPVHATRAARNDRTNEDQQQ